MSYEIIVLDIDGTLVNSEKVITPYTLKVLTNLQKVGKKLRLPPADLYRGL